MQVKLFELRDRGTLVPVVAIKIESRNEGEHYLLRRSGYELPSDLVLMAGLNAPDRITYDPHDWGGNGTRATAHDYIQKNWDKLESGQVICTEFIRGERATPKTSERFDDPF
jgi:hypothetical protein